VEEDLGNPGTTDWREGACLVFRAGPGEWFNEPHEGHWGMGDDAVKRSPSGWQLRLDELVGGGSPGCSQLIVDLTGMSTHIGADFGYLVKLTIRLRSLDVASAVVGDSRFAASVSHLGLTEILTVYDSVAAAREGLRQHGVG
jgi:hypothetical protein